MSATNLEIPHRLPEAAGSHPQVESQRPMFHALNAKSAIRDYCIRFCEELLVAHLREENRSYQPLAERIKKEMDSKFGSTWHVCVGTDFGAQIAFERDGLLAFAIQKHNFLVWKHL